MFLPSRLLDRGDRKVCLRRVTGPAGLHLQASETYRGQAWTLPGHFSSAATQDWHILWRHYLSGPDMPY